MVHFPTGDPFVCAAAWDGDQGFCSHYGGVVYLDYTAEDPHTGKEIEAMPCRRCANGEEV
jgi:hypothetical protein